MASEVPFEDDVPDDGNNPTYKWLDEWLCEYVDGTMDPSLERIFEKYVEANPELKAHVERLQQTRKLLCNCGGPATPPLDGKADASETALPEDTDREEPPSDAGTEQNQRLTTVSLTSSVAVALVVGFLVGAMVTDSTSFDLSPLSSSTHSSSNDPVTTETDQVSLFRRTRMTVKNQRAPVPIALGDSGRAPPSPSRLAPEN